MKTKFVAPVAGLMMALVLSGCGADDMTKDVVDNAANMAATKAADMMDDATTAAKDAAADAMHDAVDDMMDTGEEMYSMEDIAAHNTREDCWTTVDGLVADVTDFFGKHPGGDDNLAKACGTDATEMFQSIAKHDPNGYAQLQAHKIGLLKN